MLVLPMTNHILFAAYRLVASKLVYNCKEFLMQLSSKSPFSRDIVLTAKAGIPLIRLSASIPLASRALPALHNASSPALIVIKLSTALSPIP